ncbi:MAG: phosphoglucosamine mutase [Candidatus Cloacimonetes bacterium]|nr:phosphoglucosamine mutase [Candidatus Cloacimonadota bacterium]
MMQKLMMSVSGVRGIFGENFTPFEALHFASSFGIFQKRGTIVVGRDSRTTGETIFHAVVSGLLSVGCKVIDLGIVPTPTVLLAVKDNNADAGMVITASHNPAQWNALKLIDGNGLFLYPERSKEFFSGLERKIVYSAWDKVGSIESDYNAISRHIQKILAIPYLDLEKIIRHKFRVVVDTVNGAGGLIVPRLLKKLGCEVVTINCEPTGKFSHNPEPLAQNLSELSSAVKAESADVGFAVDPDVDRLAIVSEKGEIIGEELSLLLAEKYILPKKKGDIVTNLSSSMASDDIAAEFGVKVHRTPVGEINVGKLMKSLNSPVGGEGNGGIICPEVNFTRDAISGIAIILGLLSETDKKISELQNEIPKYYFAKEKLVVSSADIDRIMLRAQSLYPELKKDTTDGIKFVGDKFWIHIRKSGTEPIIRIYTESTSTERSELLCKETIGLLNV